ncbi:hypothetical protein [Actinomadura hibisca]|uniref:hypothetical protein n=1 Tax=Actinomadura hibisca TaxID=68565 RepID=UPI000836D73E|nr:hypothetical protein [Actinomadura hibisca]
MIKTHAFPVFLLLFRSRAARRAVGTMTALPARLYAMADQAKADACELPADDPQKARQIARANALAEAATLAETTLIEALGVERQHAWQTRGEF